MKRFLFAFGLWTSIISLFALGSLKLTGVKPEWLDFIKDWAMNVVIINTMIMTAIQGYTGISAPQMPNVAKRAFVWLAALVLPGVMLLMAVAAHAGDLPVKAPTKLANPFSQPYDITHCGAYFGVNTMATATAVNGTGVSPGTQVVQAGIGATAGYGCPINTASNSFWFAEVMADLTNINGSTTGISFNNAPVTFTERFAIGTPISNLLPSLSNFTGLTASAAVPNLPLLPTGVTASPAAPYLFLALHEQDVSAQLGLAQNREWLFSWGAGTGLLYRLSNGVVADVSAEYKLQTNQLCVGPLGQAGCAKIGQGFMTQISFKY